MTFYKHHVALLPDEVKALCANLDELSRQGWEFVAWLTGPLRSEPPSRMALLRRPDNESEWTDPA